MEVEAAQVIANGLKLVGAGLAAIGMVGAGVGVGYIEAIGRNPASKEEIGAFIWIGFAVTEAIALFALIMAFIILAS